MKKVLLLLLLQGVMLSAFAQKSVVIMDQVIFYDGYAGLSTQPTPAGVVRLKNDINATKLNPALIAGIGNQLNIDVHITARCDNYDRIGNVYLALVPKTQTTYCTDSVLKIEIGRYITPFMHKNRDPKTVSYTFNADQLTSIFHDKKLLKKYDFWVELAVFGVPYAAQKEVEGCSERNDTFEGKLVFQFTSQYVSKKESIVNLATSFMLNNYDTTATDKIGETSKTFNFNIDKATQSSMLYIITSNHGANEGGEEYIRREHFIFIDDSLVLTYTPGGKSCEPFRVRNTQPNGIYGRNPEPDSAWISWNNWCPGDQIPLRKVSIGALKPGAHRIKIVVPEAQFVDKQGYFPVSMYLVSTQKSRKLKRKK